MNLSFLFFPLLFLNCGAKHKTSAQKDSPSPKIKSETTSMEKKVAVSGAVTQSFPYCGGARPTKEIMEQLSIASPYSGKKFHVIKGEINTTSHEILLSFTSDSAGNFSFGIVPGTYAIILDEQVQAPDAKKYISQFVKMDEACFKDWWTKPYYLLEVPATTTNTSIKGLNFEFHHRCFINYDIPCLQYDGPLPP